MNEKQFRTLCREISVALNQADPEALGIQGRIAIDGVDIALFFDEKVNPDMLFCYVDMGPVPDAMRTEMYGQLLAMNLLSGAKTNGVYSLDPASGNAIFVVHFMNPEQLNPGHMAQAFSVYASQTTSLRAMLGPAPGTPHAPAAGHAETGRSASVMDLA